MLPVWSLEAAVSCPPGNDDLCGGNLFSQSLDHFCEMQVFRVLLLPVWSPEAAVSCPPGNDDLCGGNRAHLITAQICQRSPSFSALHKYHSCAPTIVLVLQGGPLGYFWSIWEVEWPSDVIMAANMVNGRQLMLHRPTEPFSSQGYFKSQILDSDFHSAHLGYLK